MKLDETYASIASATPIIAEVPVASPSNPSVRLAPFETAVRMNITIRTYTIQVRGWRKGPLTNETSHL